MILKFKIQLITCIKTFIFQHIYKAPTQARHSAYMSPHTQTHTHRKVIGKKQQNTNDGYTWGGVVLT